MIIGIDLGTTNSAAGFIRDGIPTLIPNALGELLTPSVVGIDSDGHVVVGASAKELRVVAPDRCASTFKRFMGTDKTYTLAGQTLTPVELSACILRSLKDDAESHLGASIQRAVITVPAYFNEHQRRATIRAGEAAGLQVERIVNEPTAAAIAYGRHESDAERVSLVFDLGGGTFDVSIVDQFEGVIEVRASSGEAFLGGEDFTSSVTARLLEQRGIVFEQAEVGQPQLVARLMQLAELAKCELAREGSVTVSIPAADGSLSPDSPRQQFTRSEFVEWTRHLIRRMDLPLRRVLGDAGLQRDDIDSVILVGGATRMPLIKDYLRERFECDVECRLNPDEVVAIGAAVQAGLIERNQSLEDLIVTDVAPFTLGYEVAKQFGTAHRAGYFSPLIERNSTIPVSRTHEVGTVKANQTKITIAIYQGESRLVKDNLLLGEFQVTGIPPGPPGTSVEIRFTYDLNGVLEAEATVLATGEKFTHVVTRLAEGLSEREIKETLKRMQELKRHPREDEQNRYLLRRAERLYAQLELGARQDLSGYLDAFEAALESQNPQIIESSRTQLQNFLEDLDPDIPDEWNRDE